MSREGVSGVVGENGLASVEEGFLDHVVCPIVDTGNRVRPPGDKARPLLGAQDAAGVTGEGAVVKQSALNHGVDARGRDESVVGEVPLVLAEQGAEIVVFVESCPPDVQVVQLTNPVQVRQARQCDIQRVSHAPTWFERPEIARMVLIGGRSPAHGFQLSPDL